jgi:hypothetical protein
MDRQRILRLMQRMGIPRGTDDPDLLALGVPPLHEVTDAEIAAEPSVELASDSLTAGYYLVVDGKPIRPENGAGTWATRGEALEAWDAMRHNATKTGDQP